MPTLQLQPQKRGKGLQKWMPCSALQDRGLFPLQKNHIDYSKILIFHKPTFDINLFFN